MRNRNKRNMPVVAKIGLFCFAVYAAISLIQIQLQINEKNAELDELEMQIQQSEMENSALRQSIEEGVSDDYIASIARSKLGYAYPNERKFVDASSK